MLLSMLKSVVVEERPGEEASSAANKELSFSTKDWMEIMLVICLIRLKSVISFGERALP